MSKKLYVVGGSNGYANWILPLGFTITWSHEEADALLFTGGSDIGSHLYNHRQLACTWDNNRRDQEEVEIFNRYVGKIPMMGTCRGHQLLSALSGASMIQDLSHPYKHSLHTYDGKQVVSNSLHHQAVFIPENLKENYDYLLLAWTERLSKNYEFAPNYENENSFIFPDDYKEVEAAFWPKTNCLGWQAHPEMMEQDSDFVQWCQEQVKKFIL